MENSTKNKFINFFPNCKFRYLDLTGGKRFPMSSEVQKENLNEQGFCAFFTPNGFEGVDATINSCINLNSFYIDVDEKLSDEAIEKIKEKLDPSFIISTKNGYHFYWLLDEPIYKSECSPDEWDESVHRWEKLEQNIVTYFKADPGVKDVPRILRLPDSYYWKKTGDAYKDGLKDAFKVVGIYKNTANTYSMDQVEEVFPIVEQSLTFDKAPTNEKAKKMADAEKKNFFDRVNEAYPIQERDSFQSLLKGGDDSTLPRENCANNALLVMASLMRQAGWTKDQALKHLEKTGWHGIELERGGSQEIMNTVNSAFNSGYTYSYKNEIIAHNMTPEEHQKMQVAYTAVMKVRKEQDKLRFSNYEREILSMHPYLKKNEIGIVFNYKDGVYKMMSDQEISDMVLNGLYDDMLWGYRTKRNVSDKVACLISIIPLLVISSDGGFLANVKNGLLNIYTKELQPHTPEYVSLIQYPVDFDPTATCPIWKRCVAEWMSGGPEIEEKTKLIQQYSGYLLSSSMLYDKALFMVGDGGNGKSTFIDTIAMIIGPDATSHIDLEGLYGHFGMDGLIGKRLNIIEEVHGNYYQSNKLKKLISGEKVTIDIKYKPVFTFRPQAKFVFSVNLLPRVDDTSAGTERRICVVQFINNYRKNPNVQLRSDMGLLSKELSGILNWMIDGANSLVDDGNFIVTKEQVRMLEEYRQENSSVEGFLSQCIILEKDSYIEAPDLYSEYKKWSLSDGGRKTKANITFTKEVRAYGDKDDRFTFEFRTYAGNEARFVGVALSPHWIKSNKAYNEF